MGPGSRLGHYEVVAPLGAGGMGEVYRARDTQLKRDVALKTLPAGVAGDAERLARFQREAEVLAALNHPHIAQIFGVADGAIDGVTVRALVMELVEGEDLARRLAAGAIPGAEALAIATQIGQALDYAHEHGIVHRDLKPANVKVREDGTVKVLDFGLAKLQDPRTSGPQALKTPGPQNLSASPTFTSPAMTHAGVILGTAAYMAPEQAKGRVVDKRADIWAFGCVLYEMLTGTRAFDGEDVTDSIVAVLSREPAWAALPADTPPAIRKLLRRCLEKDRARRLADIRDALFEIDEALAHPEAVADAPAPAVAPASSRRHAGWFLAGAAATAAVVGAASLTGLWPRAASGDVSAAASPLLRTAVTLPPAQPLALTARTPPVGFDLGSVAISPDGTRLAYVSITASDSAMSVIELATGRTQELKGTEGAIHGFFSPDGRQLGFLTRDRVKAVPVEGGGVQTLAEARSPTLGRWFADDSVYFTEGEGRNLSRIPASGGKPAPVGDAYDELITDVLPGGDTRLVTQLKGIGGDHHTIALRSSDGTVTPLVRQGFGATYVEPGYLVFGRTGSVFAVAFDAASKVVTGEPVLLAEGASVDSLFQVVQAAASRNGLLAYVLGGDRAMGQPAWVDRTGTTPISDMPSRVYGQISLTRDGRRLAAHVSDAVDHVWVHDLERNVGRRLPGNDAAGWPMWSWDGRRLKVNARSEGAGWRSLLQDVDGTTPNRLISIPIAGSFASAWGPGDVVASETLSPAQILVGALDAAATQAFDGFFPSFSPDGRWLAYVSDETGTNEIYVRSLPDGQVVRQVSHGGGIEPLWLAGGEVFYRVGRRWYATRVRTESSLRWDPDPPRQVFDTEFVDTPGWSYAVSPDGQRLLVVKPTGAPVDRQHIALVVNWPALLRAPRPGATVRRD